MTTNKFQLSGLTCEACVKLSKIKIGKISGVKNIEIDSRGNLEVKSDRLITKDELEKSLEGTGYQVI